MSRLAFFDRGSLALRLVVGAALWSAVALVAGGLALSAVFRDVALGRLDAQLSALLETLVATLATGPDGVPMQSRPLGETRFAQVFSGWYWQLGPSAQPLLRSRSLFDETLPLPALDDSRERRLDGPGPDGQSLRIVVRRIILEGQEAGVAVAVAADRAEVEADVALFQRTLVSALGLLGLGLVAAMVIQVRFGLGPLFRLGRAVAAIRLGRRSRLDGPFPHELAPLAEELNALILHNEAVVERARTHVGNLAHALKTPLAVIANEAATASGPLAETVARQAAVMRRQVDHYLARARTAGAGRVLTARCKVKPVLADLARVLGRIHAARALTLEIDCPEAIDFRGEREDLEEMAGNLMDNACKWARRRVAVTVAADGERLHLRVQDDGPGIDPAARALVLERGARLDESVPGSGLGLAIVRDIARLYGGEVALDSAEGGGLAARLTLPAAA